MNKNVVKFFCTKCKIKSSRTVENGIAECPNCGGKRDDGFNLVSEHNHFQCIQCKCVFLNTSKLELYCPNGCNRKELISEDKQ